MDILGKVTYLGHPHPFNLEKFIPFIYYSIRSNIHKPLPKAIHLSKVITKEESGFFSHLYNQEVSLLNLPVNKASP